MGGEVTYMHHILRSGCEPLSNCLLSSHALSILVQAGCGGKIALLGSSVEA